MDRLRANSSGSHDFRLVIDFGQGRVAIYRGQMEAVVQTSNLNEQPQVVRFQGGELAVVSELASPQTTVTSIHAVTTIR
jgi:hypothetical protein